MCEVFIQQKFATSSSWTATSSVVLFWTKAAFEPNGVAIDCSALVTRGHSPDPRIA